MDNALAELPLALFTTLAPISAGAFIALALAFFTTKFSDEQLKKIDRMTIVPFVTLVVGFIASMFHMADIGNVMAVFNRIGASPLSNEIVVGVVFCVVAAIYLIVALTGKMPLGLRKGLAALVSVAALVFAAFCGMAYMMDTIASWNTVWSPLMIVGFCLAGGMLYGSLVLSLAGSLKEAKEGSFKTAALATTVVGAVVAIGSMIAFYLMVGSMQNSLVYGSDLTAEMAVMFGVFIVLALVAAVCEWFVLAKRPATGFVMGGTAALVVAVFCARLVFYALELSVGVSI